MTSATKDAILDTTYKLVRIVVATVAIAGAVFAVFAAYLGLETSAHADTVRGLIKSDMAKLESREHATEQHERLDKRIDQIQTQQNESLGRIEATLEKLDARTWTINDRLKNQ